MTSALIGASRPEQIDENAGALANLAFTADELAEIDRHAIDSNINLRIAHQISDVGVADGTDVDESISRCPQTSPHRSGAFGAGC